jgi:hypothetical protein
MLVADAIEREIGCGHECVEQRCRLVSASLGSIENVPVWASIRGLARTASTSACLNKTRLQIAVSMDNA